MTNHDLIHYVVRRSASDAVFRAIALYDPVAALAHVAREHGLVINARRADAFAFVGSPDELPPDLRPDGPIAVVLPRPSGGNGATHGVVRAPEATTERPLHTGPQDVFSLPNAPAPAFQDAESATDSSSRHPED